MTSIDKDAERIVLSVATLIGDRKPVQDCADIMVTLEQMVATVLLITMNNNPRHAARLLNEALVPRIEERLAHVEAKLRA